MVAVHLLQSSDDLDRFLAGRRSVEINQGNTGTNFSRQGWKISPNRFNIQGLHHQILRCGWRL
jgi:hypothetical protein